MNTEITKITISTAQLRTLIPEEAIVQIERIAIEKISEEIKRKISKEQLDIKGQIKAIIVPMVKQDMADETAKLGTAWRFPNAGRVVIEGLVKKYVEDKIRSVVVDTVAATERKMAERLEKYLTKTEREVTEAANRVVAARIKELDEHISRKARAEFLAVLKEAKEEVI